MNPRNHDSLRTLSNDKKSKSNIDEDENLIKLNKKPHQEIGDH